MLVNGKRTVFWDVAWCSIIGTSVLEKPVASIFRQQALSSKILALVYQTTCHHILGLQCVLVRNMVLIKLMFSIYPWVTNRTNTCSMPLTCVVITSPFTPVVNCVLAVTHSVFVFLICCSYWERGGLHIGSVGEHWAHLNPHWSCFPFPLTWM